MNIRNANIDDLNRIHEMINRMYAELNYGISFNEDFVLGRIKSRFNIVKIAETENNAVGFCIVKIMKNEYAKDQSSMGFLSDIYIEKEYRKKGVAKELLDSMVSELLDLDIDYMELYVHKDNEKGMNFWLQNGYLEKYHVLYKDLGESYDFRKS